MDDRLGNDIPVHRIAATDLDPSSSAVDVVETHISTLVLDGDLVHKRKKHVRLPFVDLGTPERRERIFRREVALNRRFSPDVYLGVEEVVDDAGRVVDHAVLMRRMPADRRLTTLIERDGDVSACLAGVARAIAACHANSPRRPDISAAGTPDALRHRGRATSTRWRCTSVGSPSPTSSPRSVNSPTTTSPAGPSCSSSASATGGSSTVMAT